MANFRQIGELAIAAIRFILDAEDIFGSGAGEDKRNKVVVELQDLLHGLGIDVPDIILKHLPEIVSLVVEVFNLFTKGPKAVPNLIDLIANLVKAVVHF